MAVLGAVIAAPIAAEIAGPAMSACSANPVLCANEVAAWLIETVGIEGNPAAGLGLTGSTLASTLSKSDLQQLSALLAMDNKGVVTITPEVAQEIKVLLNESSSTKTVYNKVENTIVNESKVASQTEKELVDAGKGTGGTTNTAQASNAVTKPSTNATGTIPTVDQLSQAAASANRNGLTDAGRALQKHGGREGSIYTYTDQKVSTLNKEAQHVVDDILTTPGTKIEIRTVTENKQRIKVIEATAPDGRALRFNEDGTKLIGFREP